ncbi:MAG: Uma2 family endonuclease [Bacteroidota bacterium]
MQTATIDRSKTWTVEDYLQFEEGLPAQLINGELIMTPAPNPRHQALSLKLTILLEGILRKKGSIYYSPIDLYLDRKNIFQPDLLYVSNENSEIITDRGIEGAPDLIVEILSPSNHFIDRYSKKKAYLDFGVKEYWMIDYNNKTFESYLSKQENRDVPHLYLSSDGKVESPNFPEIKFYFEKLF